MISMQSFLILSMQGSLNRLVSVLLTRPLQSFWKNLLISYMTCIVLWMCLEANPILSSRKYIKTVIFLAKETIRSSTMTAQITTLRLNRRMGIRSTEKVRNTPQIQSSKWDCLWMETVSLLLFHYSLEMQMNRLP